MNECVKAALAELEAHGIRDVAVVNGSKHPQLRFRVNGGPMRMLTVAATPSDWRAPANTRRDVRKILREAGLIVASEKPAPQPPPPAKLDRVSLLEQRVAALEAILTQRSATEEFQ